MAHDGVMYDFTSHGIVGLGDNIGKAARRKFLF